MPDQDWMEVAPSRQLAELAEIGAQSWYGYVPMSDGTRLAVVVWRPAGDGKHPTILYYTPYAAAAAPGGGSWLEDVRSFLDAGYSYVGANVRGSGSSEGTFSYYAPQEGPDGAELVEWAATQPWSTGDVGMVGGSYGGHTQIKVAAQQPKHLKAIVPVAFEGNEYRDEVVPGGMMNVGLIGIWSYDIQPTMAAAGVDARRQFGDEDSAGARPEEAGDISFREVDAHRVHDDWWNERAIDRLAARVKVPTLAIHGWQDEWMRANGSLRIFKGLGAEHKRLLVQNGPHVIEQYEFNHREMMRWLDRWLKGEENGVETEPPVKVFWEVNSADGDADQPAPRWSTTHASWPPPDQTWQRLWLGGDGSLLPDDPAAEPEIDESDRRYLYPLATEMIGSNEQFAVAPTALGTVDYRTAPMEEDLTILGAPQLSLHVTCEQEDTDFMFVFKDVDPDGNTLYVQRGVLRASMRAIDEEASDADEIIHSYAAPQALTPGEAFELKVSLASVGHVVRKGHRLELSVLAPGGTPNPVWAFTPVPLPSMNKVHHGRSHPSQLALPTIPGAAQAPPAPLGSLKNQPWRPAERKA